MPDEILMGRINDMLKIYKDIDSHIDSLSYLLKRRERIQDEMSRTGRDDSRRRSRKDRPYSSDDKDELESMDRYIKENYRRLIEMRQEMDEQAEAFPKECRCSLVLFLIREFLREGCCETVMDGVKLYDKKYQTLVHSKDEKEIALLKEINTEIEKTEKRDSFLTAIDIKVREIFEEET